MLNKFLSLIGLEDADEEEDVLEEDEVEEKKAPKAAPAPARKPQPRRDATRPATGSEARRPEDMANMKMVVFHPVAYDDAQQIADNLKNRRPIIVNMEELDGATAQRVLDFLLGAVYALDGTISKISRGIFLVAPQNCDVQDNSDSGYTDL